MSKKEKKNLPVPLPAKETLVPALPVTQDALKLYLKQIQQYDLLSPQEERELSLTLIETGDLEAAKKLVQANLRLVVKIAMEYRHSYSNVLDLIQEGNIGLMKAVSRFDPDKGAKLSYYSSWWIRSYILKFILDNFRLIKIGTTQEQKKLFFNLLKEKDRLMKLGIQPEVKLLSENLGVSEKAVRQMDLRLSGPAEEVVLDAPLSDSSDSTLAEIIPGEDAGPEELAEKSFDLSLLEDHLKDFVRELKERDREIFQKRLLSEVPPSLQSIADQYGVSRERIRQIEERLLKKLKGYMQEFLR